MTAKRRLDALKRALDPTRADILAHLTEHDTVTPGDYAKQSDMALPHVSYYFRSLKEARLIELARVTPVRGTIEHHYRLTAEGRQIAGMVAQLLADVTPEPARG